MPQMLASHRYPLRMHAASSCSAPLRSLARGPGTWSRATANSSASRSAGVRKRAVAMLLGSSRKTRPPSIMEGMPSSRNSHCQPLGGVTKSVCACVWWAGGNRLCVKGECMKGEAGGRGQQLRPGQVWGLACSDN